MKKMWLARERPGQLPDNESANILESDCSNTQITHSYPKRAEDCLFTFFQCSALSLSEIEAYVFVIPDDNEFFESAISLA